MERRDMILAARAQGLVGKVVIMAGLSRGMMEGFSLKHGERQRNPRAPPFLPPSNELLLSVHWWTRAGATDKAAWASASCRWPPGPSRES